MIQASASFLAGDVSAKATMSSARSSFSSSAKTRVNFTADGIATDKYFGEITDLTALDQIQAGVARLLGDLDKQQGNVDRYYTTAYADVILGFPPNEPVAVLSEQDKAQAGPYLDAKEKSYLDSKSAECDARLAQIGKWLTAFKADTTLKARAWPAIEVQLPELVVYAGQPMHSGYGVDDPAIMPVFINGGNEVAALWFEGGPPFHVGQKRASSFAEAGVIVWPSANNVQNLENLEKLDQVRDRNGSPQRWIWNVYPGVHWSNNQYGFQENKHTIRAMLLDKDGKVINHVKDRNGRLLPIARMPSPPTGSGLEGAAFPIASALEPWPGPTGDALIKMLAVRTDKIDYLQIRRPIDGGVFPAGQSIDVEALSFRWEAGVEFRLDNAKLPNGTVSGDPVASSTRAYRYTLNNVVPGTHQLSVVPANNAQGPAVILSPITFTVTTTPIPAVIAAQPQSATVNSGNNTTFSVTATGTAPLSYVWQHNGEEIFDNARISGSASSSLTIRSVADSDAGDYSAVISNVAGSVGSANARLIVLKDGPYRLVPTVIPDGGGRLNAAPTPSSDGKSRPNCDCQFQRTEPQRRHPAKNTPDRQGFWPGWRGCDGSDYPQCRRQRERLELQLLVSAQPSHVWQRDLRKWIERRLPGRQ